MPKYLYDWYGSICKEPRGLIFPPDSFYTGTQKWIKMTERDTPEKCKCGNEKCVYIEIKYKRG